MNEKRVANIEIDVPFAQQMGKDAFAMDEGIPGGGYEVGTYQPAVVALDSNFEPLFSWASVARANNVGGAMVSLIPTTILLL